MDIFLTKNRIDSISINFNENFYKINCCLLPNEENGKKNSCAFSARLLNNCV